MNPQQSLSRTTRDGMSSKNNNGHGGWSLTYENGLKPPENKKGDRKIQAIERIKKE